MREAQEIIALEAGHATWTCLKASVDPVAKKAQLPLAAAVLKRAVPIVFVSNVQAAAEFYRDKLGFSIDFLHGYPPFYGAVTRGGACLHLRFVHDPGFISGLREREQLLSAYLEVDNVKSLFAEYKAAAVAFVQPLKKEPWGASGFTVRDPDGNWIYFAGLSAEAVG